MDFNQAQHYLDKINGAMMRLKSAHDQIAQIDIDILKTDIRGLYEACGNQLSQQPTPTRTEKVATLAGPKTIQVQEEPVREAKKVEPMHFSPERVPVQAAPVPLEIKAVRPEPVAQPTVQPVAQTIARMPEPVVPPVVVERAPVVVETPKEPLPPAKNNPSSAQASRAVLALFNLPEAKEVSERLARSPIQDVTKGISLNDKLHWPKALFDNDKGVFDHTLEQINRCANFEEAKAILVDIAVRNDWANEHKDDTAHAFILHTARRFGM
jgi:hypothetical protein